MPPLTSFIRCRPLPLADIEQLLNGPKCAQLLPYLDAAQSGSYLLLFSPLLPCSLSELRLHRPGFSTMEVFWRGYF